MEEKNRIVFATSLVGASHLPKEVPCQDYSLKEDTEVLQMIVVCDGHGSKTYVRSDVGSRLAAEIAKKNILKFVDDTSPLLFKGKNGAVTTRPAWDDDLWGAAPKKPIETMTEVELLNYEQDKLFFEQVKDIREQDMALQELFNKIYAEWLKAIQEDSQNNPFTDKEKEALGEHELVKAYGTTLMAFVETPYYWFAFHIGDGRIVAVDRFFEMTDPVPWDCNCFQNFTTSLCNTDPVRLFRYAFDGTGKYPAAVFCCSDGVEDSYGDYTLAPQYLHDFYKGIIEEFVTKGKAETLKNIDDFLPKLSEKGSRDDMSLAGIINVDALSDGLKIIQIKEQLLELDRQKEQLQVQLCEIESVNKELESRDKEIWHERNKDKEENHSSNNTTV